ncbi:MAG: c-type cytochrome biogenesis protein CcsB [Nitrospirota bacterium]|nr:c-type cytochrome biogenesis protein CcsB [Nitrospirota bacterium]
MESSLLFNLATLAYLAAMVLYVAFLVLKKENVGKSASVLAYAGLAVQTVALIMRWAESYQMGIGRVPLSNLYESLVFFTWCTVLIYVVVEWKYKTRAFGAFVMPVAFMALAFINVAGISNDITPLVPALKSNWLLYHVLLSFISYATFGVAFAVSIIYLLQDTEERGSAGYLAAALGISTVLIVLGYVLNSAGMKVQFWMGLGILAMVWFTYMVVKGALSRPQVYLFITFCTTLASGMLIFMGIDFLIFKMLHQTSAADDGFRKHMFESTFISNSIPVIAISWAGVLALFAVIWSSGLKIKVMLKQFLPAQEILDDLNYRMIAIGWPLFTAGGLVMGAIWANSAWGTYWGWDPKETWSLITWFVYSIYLHARYVRGWKGTQMAVISSIGFLSVIFTYLGVNLVLSGLHSYGGMN